MGILGEGRRGIREFCNCSGARCEGRGVRGVAGDKAFRRWGFWESITDFGLRIAKDDRIRSGPCSSSPVLQRQLPNPRRHHQPSLQEIPGVQSQEAPAFHQTRPTSPRVIAATPPQHQEKKNEPLTSNLDDDNQEFSDSARTRKRPKKINESEERLVRRELEHYRRMQRDQERPSTSSDSDSDSNSSSSSSCDSEDGAVSTSENADAIYEEKVEPECDLMKEMMRATYAKSASKNVESKNENPRLIEDKNIELEVGDKQKSKIGMVEGGGVGKGLGKGSKKK
ncbi:hypothetical protein CK203_028565 [Vitis vinifera]|uniref:Uncharacterized protein n=1 Tax=Vitis vinifera TaxID=29760 RepID=A0A438I280_VITVI|nr:hypothetical protein CK203_028565 [Vitis vinifera]